MKPTWVVWEFAFAGSSLFSYLPKNENSRRPPRCRVAGPIRRSRKLSGRCTFGSGLLAVVLHERLAHGRDQDRACFRPPLAPSGLVGRDFFESSREPGEALVNLRDVRVELVDPLVEGVVSRVASLETPIDRTSARAAESPSNIARPAVSDLQNICAQTVVF